MLVRAAVEVIGELGYEAASVSRITEKAGLAQGTFYIYFPSRQDCFDTVLPELTTELLGYIASKVHGSKDFFELEERGVLAFFDAVQRYPGLFRIVNEAQAAAPKAFENHIEQMIERYSAAMKRGIEQGDISGVSPSELREISFMLIGARNYLYLAHVNAPDVSVERLASTYMKIVRSALGERARAPS